MAELLPAGEMFLSNTPVLRSHAGTQPDLFLRWNDIPGDAAAVDVVVHLHGFSQQRGDMQLAEKLPRCGLDLSGRERPTLAVLPRGNWIQRTWYDFPALIEPGGLDALAEYALTVFQERRRPVGKPGQRPALPAIDRLILTGHSGGGMPAVDAIAAARRKPDELHVFDGLYGRDPAGGDPMQGIEVIEAWLAERVAAEPRRPGALRVVYIENQTGRFSRAADRLIEQRLAVAPAGLAPILAPRYRVERSAVPHGYVAAVCGPWLLADPGADLDWSKV